MKFSRRAFVQGVGGMALAPSASSAAAANALLVECKAAMAEEKLTPLATAAAMLHCRWSIAQGGEASTVIARARTSVGRFIEKNFIDCPYRGIGGRLYVKAGNFPRALALHAQQMFARRDGRTAFQPSKPLALLEQAASAGDALGQMTLGVFFERGDDVDKDEARAARLYQQAAEQGLAAAKIMLGLLFEDGRGGLPQDAQKADALYTEAAGVTAPHAWAVIGFFFQYGHHGIWRDRALAARFYEKAAQAGDNGARNALGGLLNNDDDWFVPRDPVCTVALYPAAEAGDAEALELFQRAADMGDSCAMARLGMFYERGTDVVQAKDEAKALELYLRSARSGDPHGMSLLAGACRSGLGDMAVDEKKAEALDALRYDLVEVHGWDNLGWAYAASLGPLPADELGVMAFYKRAARSGDAAANYHLGRMYLLGLGVHRDWRKAFGLYDVAAASGLEEAKTTLKLLGDLRP